MLTTEDATLAAETERFAVEVAARAKVSGGILDEALKRELATAVAERDARTVMTTRRADRGRASRGGRRPPALRRR